MEFLEEVVSESEGVSSKKWALMLVALVAGAVLALWLSGRARRTTEPAVSIESET